MKTTKILAGYRVSIDSYENDGDFKKTTVKEGLKSEEVKFIVALYKVINKRKTGLENEYEPSDAAYENGYAVLLPIFEKFGPTLSNFDEHIINVYRKDGGAMIEYIQDMMLGFSEQGYALRVATAIKIEFIPTEIILNDVTDEFIKS